MFCPPSVKFGGCSVLHMRTEVIQQTVGFICLLQSNDGKQQIRSNRRFFSPHTQKVTHIPTAAHLSSPLSVYLSPPARPSVLLSRAIRHRSMHHLLVRGGGGGDEWNAVGGRSLSHSVSQTLNPHPHPPPPAVSNDSKLLFSHLPHQRAAPQTGSSPLLPHALC